jgi:hypothetical protein
MIHPFFQFGGILDTARIAMKDAASALRGALGNATPAGTSL